MVNLAEVALILDIDGVIRDCADSYHRALADTVEHFTNYGANPAYRPTNADIDRLKTEGIWNNDWEASLELVKRHFQRVGAKNVVIPEYEVIIKFFQERYWGADATPTGYVCHEPLIANLEFFKNLTAAAIAWGFFSGATRRSATYVLDRVGIPADDIQLVAMEDAPGKPDPTGLFQVLAILETLGETLGTLHKPAIAIYAGDTVADMLTVVNARKVSSDYRLIAVGLLPPHVHHDSAAYAQSLRSHGADVVLTSVLELTPATITNIIKEN